MPRGATCPNANEEEGRRSRGGEGGKEVEKELGLCLGLEENDKR